MAEFLRELKHIFGHLWLYEKLKEHVDKLAALLADQEDGMFTWHQFVHEEWRAIAESYSRPATLVRYISAPDEAYALTSIQCGHGCEFPSGIAYCKLPRWKVTLTAEKVETPNA